MTDRKINSLEELQKVIDVSNNCKLCRPYILNMIETGQTVFNEIIRE